MNRFRLSLLLYLFGILTVGTAQQVYQQQATPRPNPCLEYACPPCHECRVNMRNEAKCVYVRACCPAGTYIQPCSRDPCTNAINDCPRAIKCVPMVCNGCNLKARYYDELYNEIRSCPLNAAAATSPAQVCRLPLQVGSCYETFSRWYYDRQQGKCVVFSYSGCHGNENNFERKEECERMCGNIGSEYS